MSWAIGDTRRWWEPFGLIIPAPPPEYYWPPHLPNDGSVNTYAQFLAGHGFVPCANGDPELGTEKVAIYSREGEFKHIARQLPNGLWSSKAGVAEDFEHTLDGLSGRENMHSYGEPSHFFSRPRP